MPRSEILSSPQVCVLCISTIIFILQKYLFPRRITNPGPDIKSKFRKKCRIAVLAAGLLFVCKMSYVFL
ncbi:hypothetical protein HMPREF0766_10108 [Sphingobacterium spiritivorum ATCC 33861]|uniref:Uncharacterized protein n=1 Tax=Sphingobacterium spiritivorum ATCC 33861 TaxID=525373 RepID=D7VGI9_SPHSI|nr:hypothetical protein HMPREF0766_10108 [Sphingobacterium spiritivorum ATCC 33861]